MKTTDITRPIEMTSTTRTEHAAGMTLRALLTGAVMGRGLIEARDRIVAEPDQVDQVPLIELGGALVILSLSMFNAAAHDNANAVGLRQTLLALEKDAAFIRGLVEDDLKDILALHAEIEAADIQGLPEGSTCVIENDSTVFLGTQTFKKSTDPYRMGETVYEGINFRFDGCGGVRVRAQMSMDTDLKDPLVLAGVVLMGKRIEPLTRIRAQLAKLDTPNLKVSLGRPDVVMVMEEASLTITANENGGVTLNLPEKATSPLFDVLQALAVQVCDAGHVPYTYS